MTGIVVRNEDVPSYGVTTYMPQMTVDQAVQRRDELVKFVKRIMVKDTDYGVIPGTDKPTLLKPGAEKLATFFGLYAHPILMDKMEDWDGGRFHYRYSCELYHNNVMVGAGEGSANSLEKRYRWRYVPEFKATDDEKDKAIRREERISRKNGKPFTMLVLENDDPYTLVNTLVKMAQKRALIAAVLVAVNASEFFTQDIEDMDVGGDIVESEAVDVKPEQKPVAKPPQEPPKSTEARPLSPERVREVLHTKAQGKGTGAASEKQAGLLVSLLDHVFGDDEKIRHLCLSWLWEYESGSVKELTIGQASATIDWLISGSPKGTYELNADSREELLMVYRQAQKDAGQGTLV